jgi:LysM repeat protein
MTTNHDDFWGDQADWPTASIPITRHERDADRTGEVRGAAGFTASRRRPRRESGTGQIPITRQHRQVDASPTDRPVTADHEMPPTSTSTPTAGPTSTRSTTPPVTGTTPRSSRTAPPSPDGGGHFDASRSETLNSDAPGSDAPHSDARSTDGGPGPVWDAHWVSTTGDERTGIDPRLFRLGAVAVIVTLLVPLLAGLRSAGGGDLEPVATEVASTELFGDARAGEVGAIDGTIVDAAAPTTEVGVFSEDPDSAVDTAQSPSEIIASDDVDEAAGATADVGESDATPSADAAITEAATASAQICATDYDVQVGDFWIRLADGAGVDLAELLEANAATTDTPLYPGSTICLPAGAAAPPPPPAPTGSAGSSGDSTATTPPTPAPTPAPASTPAPTSPPTTAAPTTTSPPPAPRPTTPPPAEIERIVRSVWPDDLEDRALEIVRRESNFQANVNNYCCYGLFQIYWNVHKGWLAEMGVTSADQLFDAETNARAALTLYQRSGGWGPWGG